MVLHAPERQHRVRLDVGRGWITICTCGFHGPATLDSGDQSRLALAEVHALSEPDGCADCGEPAPIPPAPPADAVVDQRLAWHRYHLIERSEEWVYVCHDMGACRQRQRGSASTSSLVDDPMGFVDRLPDTFEVTLDTSDETIHRGTSISEAIALFQLAKSRAPRTWDGIVALDVRALLALVTAIEALHESAADARRHVVMCARKAGATWEDIALATGIGDGDATQRHYVREEIADYDWPQTLADEVSRLSQPDLEPLSADNLNA